MDHFPRSQGSIIERSSSVIEPFMAQVYGWMSCGLLLTAFVSWYAARTPAIVQLIFSSQLTFICLIVSQLALVFVISGMVERLNETMATSLFMLYSAITGLTMSSIFIIYTASSIAITFIVTSSMFGVMSIYGYTTKCDLSKFSSLLFMSLIGISIASIINIWLKSTPLMWAITYIGVLVFVGLTAYDVQKLKNLAIQLSSNSTVTNKEQFHKLSIVGALILYLDFINLFLIMLRISNDRR